MRSPAKTSHPGIREPLRGIARPHGEPPRRSAALTTVEIRRLSMVCGTDVARIRDRALLLVGFAGALRRSELVALNVERVTWTKEGMRLLIVLSKSDKEGADTEIGIVRRPSGRDVVPRDGALAVAGEDRDGLILLCQTAQPIWRKE